MNWNSERGQGAVVALVAVSLLIIGIFVLAWSGSQHGAQTGADTIGNAVGNAIDNTSADDQEWRNIDWQIQNGTVVSFWVNSQRIYPNKHAADTHDADATLATDCYNRNGAFMTARSGLDWHLLCRDNDGSVRTTVWQQESANSNRFHMKSAYTPKGGNWAKIMDWMQRQGFSKQNMPADTTFVIDGNIP